MLKTIVDVSGLAVLAASVLVLAWQTKISNDIAGASVLNNAMGADRDVDKVMLQYPGLRAYFYDDKPCPPRGRERERVLLITGMYADALEAGLMATDRVRASESHEDWRSYSPLRARPQPDDAGIRARPSRLVAQARAAALTTRPRRTRLVSRYWHRHA